jgi:small subunit ribosomal protein S6
MYVVRPDVSEDDLAAVMQRTADTVTQVGAAVELNEVWERRELAYEIDDCTRGTYCLMYFESEGSVVEALRRELELDEQVLRSVVFVANPAALWRPVAPEEADEGEAEDQGDSEQPAEEAPPTEEQAPAGEQTQAEEAESARE